MTLRKNINILVCLERAPLWETSQAGNTFWYNADKMTKMFLQNFSLPESHGVDPALFSLNWFLCLFVEYLPVNTYLHIWDAFLFEGSKVGRMRYNLIFSHWKPIIDCRFCSVTLWQYLKVSRRSCSVKMTTWAFSTVSDLNFKHFLISRNWPRSILIH